MLIVKCFIYNCNSDIVLLIRLDFCLNTPVSNGHDRLIWVHYRSL